MLRRVGAWVLLAVVSVALGLGVSWIEGAIPRNVITGFWIVLLTAALGFAGWAAWRYYQAIRDEDEWE